MNMFKNDLENYIEKLAIKDKRGYITYDDIEKLVLLMLGDNDLEKLNFDKLTDRFSFVSSIMTKLYLEKRYG